MKIGELYFNFQNENAKVNGIPLRRWLENEQERLRKHEIFTVIEQQDVVHNKREWSHPKTIHKLSLRRVALARFLV